MLGAILMMGSLSYGQTGSASKAGAAKPASAAKPAAAPSSAAKPMAVIDTAAGKMTCTLFPDKAPVGVANFVGLATGTKDWKNPVSGATKHGVPLYDGTIFHRVIPGFMIQGGDPAGTGSGADPVAPFRNEVSPDLHFDRAGRLAYANTGQPVSNSAQFFITEGPTPHLNGGYTIFGQCDDATVALVKQIASMTRDSNDRPYRPIRITHITIQKGGSSTAAKPASSGIKKPTAATAKPSANPK
jgi:peptidyl-prolyl cis-trans isomerase A (cyclophilin A)